MAIIDVSVDEEWTHLYHPVMMVDIVRLLAQPVPRKIGVIITTEKGSLSLPGCYVRINLAHTPHL